MILVILIIYIDERVNDDEAEDHSPDLAEDDMRGLPDLDTLEDDEFSGLKNSI